MDRAAAIELVHGLVAIPSLSRQEAVASTWLVSQMRGAGFDRAFVDDAGNAVGELGDLDAPRTIVLLGHIDTVPGNIPVRIEDDLLYGRGSVDAKGPLATFVAGAARFGSAAAKAANLRVVVVGAVEEEAATSKGARFIAARFDGSQRARAGCVHHRRAEPLESRHARIQRPSAARSHGRSADGAYRRSRCERRLGRGRSLELGHGACGPRQCRQRQGVRSTESEPAALHHRHQRRRCTTPSTRNLRGGCRWASMPTRS